MPKKQAENTYWVPRERYEILERRYGRLLEKNMMLRERNKALKAQIALNVAGDIDVALSHRSVKTTFDEEDAQVAVERMFERVEEMTDIERWFAHYDIEMNRHMRSQRLGKKSKVDIKALDKEAEEKSVRLKRLRCGQKVGKD